MLGDGYFMIPIKELKINNLAFTNLRTKEVGRISEIRQNIIKFRKLWLQKKESRGVKRKQTYQPSQAGSSWLYRTA